MVVSECCVNIQIPCAEQHKLPDDAYIAKCIVAVHPTSLTSLPVRSRASLPGIGMHAGSIQAAYNKSKAVYVGAKAAPKNVNAHLLALHYYYLLSFLGLFSIV